MVFYREGRSSAYEEQMKAVEQNGLWWIQQAIETNNGNCLLLSYYQGMSHINPWALDSWVVERLFIRM